jgi:predicted dehydrogenase
LSAQVHKGVKVLAVCDANPAALDLVTEPGVRKYSDWRDLLAKEDLDLVMLCLPHYLYCPVACAALKRGFHVYKDKPFAKDLADARKMVAAARRHRRRIFVGAQRKFSPSFLQAKSIVDQGKLGKVHFVRGAIHYYWRPVFTNTMGWRGRREQSGGIAIIDSGYHILDAVSALHGKPASVFAATGRLRAVEGGKYDIDDKATLVLNYKDGSLGSITISFATVPGEFRIVLHGQKGTLDVTGSKMDLYSEDKLVEQMVPDDYKVNLLEAQFAHCARALTKAEPSLCDVERALDVQKVIEASYESARTGQVARVR